MRLVKERADTAKEHADIPDIQSQPDTRQLPIDRVGIKDIRHPVVIVDRSGHEQHTVASFNMYVRLPHRFKGTHMSRFVDVLHNHREAVSVASFGRLLAKLSARLGAPAGRLELTFPYFVSKRAPVSGMRSLLDYRVTLSGEIDHGAQQATVGIVIPVTSLCPCSKEISEYGAHNQRSHIGVEVCSPEGILIEELIDLVEGQASSELYGLLKRPDEKFITEQAYDNPKFVEDVVRDVAGTFNRDARISRYSVSVENFESIHNHSAYARISRDKNGE